MLSAFPQNMEYSSTMIFLLCHAPKSASLWMVTSSNITVCPAASSGGALVSLRVIAEPYLSKYANILLMMAGSMIHAIIVTLCVWHFSHWLSSLFISLGLFLPHFEAVTWARRLLLGANTPKNRVRLMRGGGMRAASLPGSSALANISRHEVAACNENPDVLANFLYSLCKN